MSLWLMTISSTRMTCFSSSSSFIHSALVGYLVCSWVPSKFVHPWEYSPRFLFLIHPLYRFPTCQFALSMVLLSTSPLCCKASNTHPPLYTRSSMLYPHIHPWVLSPVHPSLAIFITRGVIHPHGCFLCQGWFSVTFVTTVLQGV